MLRQSPSEADFLTTDATRKAGRSQAAQESWARAIDVDRAHAREVKHAGVAAHRVMFLELRAVVQRRVPTAEIDDARPELDVADDQRGVTPSRSPVTAAAAVRRANIAVPSPSRIS